APGRPRGPPPRWAPARPAGNGRRAAPAVAGAAGESARDPPAARTACSHTPSQGLEDRHHVQEGAGCTSRGGRPPGPPRGPPPPSQGREAARPVQAAAGGPSRGGRPAGPRGAHRQLVRLGHTHPPRDSRIAATSRKEMVAFSMAPQSALPSAMLLILLTSLPPVPSSSSLASLISRCSTTRASFRVSCSSILTSTS